MKNLNKDAGKKDEVKIVVVQEVNERVDVNAPEGHVVLIKGNLMEEVEQCGLCLASLSEGPATRYEHPINDNCTGFNLHASCLAFYIDNHLTKNTNLVCLRCKLDLSPFHTHRQQLTPLEMAERRVQLAEQRVRLEIAERAENPFRRLPLFTYIIHGVVAGHTVIRIVTNRPDYEDLAKLGLCTIYAYSRDAPYLRRVICGGTRKRRGTRKGGANQLVIIHVRHPTQALIETLEYKFGKSKEIKPASLNTVDLSEWIHTAYPSV